MRVLRDYRGKAALVLGAWCGALVNSKELFVLALPGAFLLALWHHRQTLTRKETLKRAGLGLLGAAPFLAIQFVYNTIRTGSPFRTAYGPAAVSFVFGTQTVDGFWGLWASPGKSIFLYNPPLVLALFGIPLILRRCRLWLTALGVGGHAICSSWFRCSCCRAHFCWTRPSNGGASWLAPLR
jgi:4-amino-4-deoxy-L-arabinose transferase-like glycosyltransferase